MAARDVERDVGRSDRIAYFTLRRTAAMLTLVSLCDKVKALLDAELAHSSGRDEAGREERLRQLREIELTARLRHGIGGLDTLMSARGADIGSTDPLGDIQVKFPNYWHAQTEKPQPI